MGGRNRFYKIAKFFQKNSVRTCIGKNRSLYTFLEMKKEDLKL